MENEKKKGNSLKTKIITGLLSLVVAFGLWMYVVTVASPESENTYYNIPITLQNEGDLEERGLMVTTEDLPTVSLRLSGNRTDLQKLNSSNISVYVDLSKLSKSDEPLSYTIAFPGDVPNNAITILKRTPDTIKLKVEERASKTVKLQVAYNGDQAEGFSVDKENAEFNYKQFQIEGPKRILDQIVSLRVNVDLKDRKESITDTQLAYILVNSAGGAVDSTFVDVFGVSEDDAQNTEELEGYLTLKKLRIASLEQVELQAVILPGGGATEKNTQVDIQPKTITISGNEQVIAQLNGVLEIGEIDLGQYPEDTQLTIPVQQFLPDGVVCESGETEITVDIRFPNLRTKSLNITKITPVNVPEGLSAQVITKVIEVQFRGPKALVDTISTSDVEATVDFTDAKAGSETRQVIIKLADKYGDVGAVGTYTVSTTVK